MKTNQHKRLSLLAAQEQPIRGGFTPFIQQQQQAAKSGIVTADGEDPNQVAIAASDPLRANMGALAVLALKAKTAAATLVGVFGIATLIRKLSVGDGDVLPAVMTAMDAVTGTIKVAELTFDGTAKNNAPMTNAVADGVGGLSTQINARLATAKPDFSLASAISMIEDEALNEGKEIAWAWDQSANSGRGKLVAYVCATAGNAESAYLASLDELNDGSAVDVTFTQDVTPVSDAEKLAGE